MDVSSWASATPLQDSNGIHMLYVKSENSYNENQLFFVSNNGGPQFVRTTPDLHS